MCGNLGVCSGRCIRHSARQRPAHAQVEAQCISQVGITGGGPKQADNTPCNTHLYILEVAQACINVVDHERSHLQRAHTGQHDMCISVKIQYKPQV